MRTYLLLLVVVVLTLYAWRDWFRALCGLIVLTAFIEHPDMPKNIAGIQGLNPWNFVLASVVAAWFIARYRERLRWDMPRGVNALLLLYLLVFAVGCGRMLLDRSYIEEYSTVSLLSEYVINSLKFAVPALLLFDGCRTRKRLVLALVCSGILFVLLSVQVIRCSSLGALRGESNLEASRHRVQKRTGYNAVNVAAMLAGASWGLLAVRPLLKRRWQRTGMIGLAVIVLVAQGLTGGRMGFVAWGAVGLTLCFLRWRRYLVLAPLAPVVLALAFPAVAERMVKGFGESGLAGERVADDDAVTSGRSTVWPHVLEEIQTSPVWGHGQLAMTRTGLRARLPEELAESFAHPHNAYLEALLDWGAVGLAVVLAFYGTILVMAARLFCDRQRPWCSAIGGWALALVLGQLVASLGSQHFYPREGVVGMWLAIGLMLRVWVLRTRAVQRAPQPVRTVAPVRRLEGLAVNS